MRFGSPLISDVRLPATLNSGLAQNRHPRPSEFALGHPPYRSYRRQEKHSTRAHERSGLNDAAREKASVSAPA
ncbi:hypothetical protein KCP78_19390 [Salmonella enterica subsp. enterica]|nr:hypothetical protein KCP78_19390 [Salmonella enterica subsp. enterica]